MTTCRTTVQPVSGGYAAQCPTHRWRLLLRYKVTAKRAAELHMKRQAEGAS